MLRGHAAKELQRHALPDRPQSRAGRGVVEHPDPARGLLWDERFDEFQKSLAIAPNILTRRLNALVKAGLLKRRRYSHRPPRYEYVLTERGRDFWPVMQAMLAWGNRRFAPEGPSVVIMNREPGETADPVLIDRISG